MNLTAHHGSRLKRTRASASLLRLLLVAALASATGAAHADDSDGNGKTERFAVELRVVEGTPGDNSRQRVDPRLATFARDLRALPFSELKLIDSHTTAVREGERVSLEMPPAKGAAKGEKRRFLQVAAHGRQAGGKLRFQLSIDALRFDTLVAVPDGGTIFVAVPKKNGPALLVAFTARAQK